MHNDISRLYSASELAAEFQTTPRALRFYETKKLLCPRRAGNRRIYDYRDRARLNLILRGKRLGFSLADIREYLELYEIDTTHASQLKRLNEQVNTRIVDLEHQHETLERTLTELHEIRRQVKEALKNSAIDNGRNRIEADADAG